MAIFELSDTMNWKLNLSLLCDFAFFNFAATRAPNSRIFINKNESFDAYATFFYFCQIGRSRLDQKSYSSEGGPLILTYLSQHSSTLVFALGGKLKN